MMRDCWSRQHRQQANLVEPTTAVIDPHWRGVWTVSVWLILLAGCQFPANRPVWLADSSGVVVGDQYFDLAKKQKHTLQPNAVPGFQHLDTHVDPHTRRVMHASIQWDEERPTTAKLLITTVPGPEQPVGEPIPFPLTFPPEFDHHAHFPAPSTGGLEIHPAPKGSRVLVAVGMYTSIVDLKTREVIVLPEITPPLRFARVLGISPYRPDGSGFLALRKRLSSEEMAGVKFDPEESYLTSLRRMHNAFVFVNWDGTVTPLDGWNTLPDVIPMLEFSTSGRFPTVFRFPGDAAWQEGRMGLKLGDFLLELDTAAHAVRYTDSTKQTPDDLGERFLQELTAPQMVELNHGECVVRTRLQPPDKKIADITQVRMALTVQRRDEPTERVIDVSESGFVFELSPAPNGQAIVCRSTSPSVSDHAAEGRTGCYSIVLDQRGELVTSFGITEQDWRWRSADRSIGLPEETTHTKFGKGYVLNEAHCSARTIEFMLAGQGQFAPLRQTGYLELNLPADSSRVLPSGLSSLAAFPKLQALKLNPGSSEHALSLSELPQVTGLSASLTDDLLERLPRLEQITKLELVRPTPKTVFRNDRPETEDVLSTAGLQQLAKFPHVKDLTIPAPVNPVAQPRFSLPELTELTTLSIHCEERTAALDHLGNLPSLRSLHLQSRTITGPALEAVNAAVALESLTISGASVELPETPIFTRLTTLKQLNLQVGRGITQRLLESLGALRGLESLKLQGQTTEPLDLSAFQGLTALRHLEIAISQAPEDDHFQRPVVYTHLSLAPLKALTALETLTLTSITTDAQELSELRTLTRLKRAHLGKATDPHQTLCQLSTAIPAARLSIYYPTKDSVRTAIFKGGLPLKIR